MKIKPKPGQNNANSYLVKKIEKTNSKNIEP